jgi:hypothetical protein
MRPGPRSGALALVAAICLLAGACDAERRSGGGTAATTRQTAVIDPGDGGAYHPSVDPTKFVEVIDNPYMPLQPGASWTYTGTVDGERQRNDVVVRPEHKTIMGIPAAVVRDTVKDADGAPIEVTTDWYAQDTDGNVWYLGEDSKELQNGKVTSTQGSWEAGVGGALPGIIMLAQPAVGTAYRQEFLRGEAEDLAKVVRLGESAKVAAGSYDSLLVTREWTPLEPKNIEDKYYAPGVGNVLDVLTAGELGRMELTRFTPGAR